MPVARNVWQHVEEGSPARVRPALHHPEHVRARHRIRRDLPPLVHAPEERRLLFVPDAGRIEIRIEIRFGIVVAGDFVPLAAFFMQPNPPPLAVLVIVFDVHIDHRRDAREGVAHEPDDRAIAEADDGIRLDRIEERPRLVGFEDRRLAALHDVLRPADGGRRVHRERSARSRGNRRASGSRPRCCFTVGAATGWFSM